MKVQSINNTNVNYNTRMRFGNKTKQATTVAKNIAQKAVPITLTIGGVTYTGATTHEIVSRYLTNKIGRIRFNHFNNNYDEHSKDYDPVDNEFPLEANLNDDVPSDALGFQTYEIFRDIVRATGNDPLDDFEVFSTVKDAVDFLDSHLPVNQ